MGSESRGGLDRDLDALNEPVALRQCAVSSLDGSRTLQQQLAGALAHPYSPNWQDASTQEECDQFDAALGSENALAQVTGSKAHHVRSDLGNLSAAS